MSFRIASLVNHVRPLLIAASLGAATVSAQAALVNGSFESGNLTGWTTGGASISASQAHTGTYSVAAEGGAFIRQNFAAIDVDDITGLSFWVRRLQGGALNYVQFFYSDTTTSDYLFNTLDSDITTWQFADLTGQLQAGKSLSGFLVYGTTAGPAYLDDFVLTTVNDGGTVPEPSTLALGGLAVMVAAMASRRRRTH